MRGEQAVGGRVQVYWEGEDEWFDGVVAAYSAERGYYVQSAAESARAASPRDSVVDNNEADAENYDEAEEENEDEQEAAKHQAGEADEAEREATPVPEQEDLTQNERAALSSTKQKKIARRARAFMRSSAAFFRDEDTLREMRQELRHEKRTLANQLQTLTMQLAEKQQVSAALKGELQQLKTSAALANVMRQVPRSVSFSGSPSGTLKSLSKPKTAVQWGERVLDQKLENQCLADDLLVLKTAVQEKQLAIQRKQKQRDEMNTKLARVPRRHLCTLVDVQVEIARLLEEKRALESQSPPHSSRIEMETLATSEAGTATKTALQNELASLEITAERYKEELRQWALKIDCEKARLAPLETRLASLQEELRRFENSQVLLRSVFLRLVPDVRDGCVPSEAALAAFQTLAPLDRPTLSVEDMIIRLQARGIVSSDIANQSQRFSFAQFVDAFDCLFKS
ncbi:unnamed protein product [Phytophthora lilii]|uniref:Unnamed protein product n=1 Tax=Phytophthora lilii TaxID=2077276 RepID=A0A9W6U1H4_9STRA|nr:unnamed protein product [Phytophthora lilii]